MNRIGDRGVWNAGKRQGCQMAAKKLTHEGGPKNGTFKIYLKIQLIFDTKK